MFKKILTTLLSVTLLFSITTVNCENVKAENANADKKRAIIVVPGIYTSGLFYCGQTCKKYYKNEAVWLPLDSNHKWRMIKGIAKFRFFYNDLYCDENGKPVNKNIGLLPENSQLPYLVDEDIAKYGVANSYKKLVDTLATHFPKDSVFLYNYDWRFDIDKAATNLAQEIQKYDEVVLVGHSLGGIVACRSAVLLQKLGCLDKIKKYISIAVPYNGTAEAFFVLNKGLLTENDFMGKIIEILGVPKIIRNMAKNCEIAYQMLPNKNYLERAQKKGYLCDKTGHVFDYDRTLEYIKECDFSKKQDGKIKSFLNAPHAIYDSLIVDSNHILNYLDYHIIAGFGLKTMSLFGIDPKNHENITIEEYVDGDGSIALNESALPFDNIDSSRVSKVNGRHQFLIGDSKVIKKIVDIIENNVSKLDTRLNLAA